MDHEIQTHLQWVDLYEKIGHARYPLHGWGCIWLFDWNQGLWRI